MISSDIEGKTIQLELGVGDVGVNSSELGDVQTIQRFIEKQTGFLTVVKGLGHLSAAVAELKSPPCQHHSSQVINDELPSTQHQRGQVMGVVRLSQLNDGYCFVDGALDGLNYYSNKQGHKLSLAVHEFGDLEADDFKSIGKPLIHIDNQLLGSSDKLQTVSVRKTVPNCNVAELIGRSIAVSRLSDNASPKSGEQGEVLSAGVIARASTILENPKQFCSCSGRTLWEERIDKKQQSEMDR